MSAAPIIADTSAYTDLSDKLEAMALVLRGLRAGASTERVFNSGETRPVDPPFSERYAVECVIHGSMNYRLSTTQATHEAPP